jgi:hypothetical protein
MCCCRRTLFLTKSGSGCLGLPIAALAISHKTVGKFLEAANLDKLDSNLLHLTKATTRFFALL